MCDYWCNFIHTGDPNGVDSQNQLLPAWPAFNPADPVRMRFAETAEPEACPMPPLEAFLLERYLDRV